jgi:periplasmic protein TonB
MLTARPKGPGGRVEKRRMPKRNANLGPGNDGNDLFPGMHLEEKPIWSGLYESFRDALFPPKLPPLELTSTPIPVIDRMAGKTNPWAVGTATVVNGGILAIVILLGLNVATHHLSDPARSNPIDLSQWKLPVLAKANSGGGGGGSNDLIDPIVGRPPKIEVTPLAPPQVAIIDTPKLAVNSAIAAPPDVKLPDETNVPNLGVAKSPNVTLLSDGPGAHNGIGWRGSGGDGPGDGSEWGPGSGNGIYVPGRGGVTAPVPIVAPEAEFSDEARREKYQGTCMVALIVDTHGYPQNLHVIQRLGMGLDEKALEAIRKYRFKPAMKDGKPVAAAITVAVDFRLF